MFDVRTMSSVAPMSDLLLSIGVVFGAMCVANVLVIPALASQDRVAAGRFLLSSASALLGVVAILALRPSAFFLAAVAYAVLFAVAGGVLSWRRGRSPRVSGRVAGAVLVQGVAVAVSAWLVHMPR